MTLLEFQCAPDFLEYHFVMLIPACTRLVRHALTSEQKSATHGSGRVHYFSNIEISYSNSTVLTNLERHIDIPTAYCFAACTTRVQL